VAPVDTAPISNKFKWLRCFWIGCTVARRLAAADSYGRPAGWAGSTGRGHGLPLPKSNAGQSDAEPVRSARLGSPFALQRRTHPGEGGWIPARLGAWSTRVCIWWIALVAGGKVETRPQRAARTTAPRLTP